jgi:hypothetical protein
MGNVSEVQGELVRRARDLFDETAENTSLDDGFRRQFPLSFGAVQDAYIGSKHRAKF